MWKVEDVRNAIIEPSGGQRERVALRYMEVCSVRGDLVVIVVPLSLGLVTHARLWFPHTRLGNPPAPATDWG